MAAISMAQKTLAPAPPAMQMELLKALDGLGLLQESVEDILAREEISNLFKKEKKKRSSKTIEERAGHYDDSKCQARVWKRMPGDMSFDNLQCTHNIFNGGCFCKRHQTQVDKHGSWWLGKINEPRPEEPHGPPDSKNPRIHKWNTDSEGNEIVHEKKKKTPKKSSAKKATKASGEKKKKKAVEEVKEWTEEELMALLEQKKKEQYEKEKKEEEEATDNLQSGAGCFPTDEETEDMSDEEETFDTITVDGVEYQLNKEDMSVIRCDDFTPVGHWNKETESIDFDEEE